MPKPKPVAPIRTCTVHGRTMVLLQLNFRDMTAIVADIAGYVYKEHAGPDSKATIRGTHKPRTVSSDDVTNIKDGLTVRDAQRNQAEVVAAAPVGSGLHVKTTRIRR